MVPLENVSKKVRQILEKSSANSDASSEVTAYLDKLLVNIETTIVAVKSADLASTSIIWIPEETNIVRISCYKGGRLQADFLPLDNITELNLEKGDPNQRIVDLKLTPGKVLNSMIKDFYLVLSNFSMACIKMKLGKVGMDKEKKILNKFEF